MPASRTLRARRVGRSVRRGHRSVRPRGLDSHILRPSLIPTSVHVLRTLVSVLAFAGAAHAQLVDIEIDLTGLEAVTVVGLRGDTAPLSWDTSLALEDADLGGLYTSRLSGRDRTRRVQSGPRVSGCRYGLGRRQQSSPDARPRRHRPPRVRRPAGVRSRCRCCPALRSPKTSTCSAAASRACTPACRSATRPPTSRTPSPPFAVSSRVPTSRPYRALSVMLARAAVLSPPEPLTSGVKRSGGPACCSVSDSDGAP